MKKVAALFLLPGLLLSDHLAARAPTGEYYVEIPQTELSEILYKQATECWVKGVNLFNESFEVTKSTSGDRISARLVTHGWGRTGTSAVIKIIEEEGITKVEVTEKEHKATGRRWFTSDIQRWIYGDLTCRKPLQRDKRKYAPSPQPSEFEPKTTY